MLRIHSTVLKHHTGCHRIPGGGCVLFRSVSVVLASGKRPVPFRTRKLSLIAPMVLQPKGCGRVGHRRTQPTGWVPVENPQQVLPGPSPFLCPQPAPHPAPRRHPGPRPRIHARHPYRRLSPVACRLSPVACRLSPVACRERAACGKQSRHRPAGHARHRPATPSRPGDASPAARAGSSGRTPLTRRENRARPPQRGPGLRHASETRKTRITSSNHPSRCPRSGGGSSPPGQTASAHR